MITMATAMTAVTAIGDASVASAIVPPEVG